MTSHIAIGAAIFSGAISAAVGAGIYHFVGHQRTRRRLIKALQTELNTIENDLENQISELNSDDQARVYSYNCNVINVIGTADPYLYSKIIDNTDIDHLYSGLRQWNEDQVWLKRDEDKQLEEMNIISNLNDLIGDSQQVKHYLQNSDNWGYTQRILSWVEG